MELELSSENDPLDANLEKVLPSLHEWHRINKDAMMHLKQAVTTMGSKMEHIDTKMDSGFGEIKETLMSNKVQLKQELAGSFLEIAKYLVKDAGGEVSDRTTVAEIVDLSRMTLVEPATANAAQDTGEPSPETETDPAEEHRLFRMIPKHLTLLDLVHEWFGTGDYYDEYGGIEGRNKSSKSRWRKYCCINQMQYSRTERSVKAVQEYARRKNIDMYLAAEQLQERFEECKCSVAKFVTWAHGEELLAKKKSRGKNKRVEENASEEEQ
jgi:hypothetical protein